MLWAHFKTIFSFRIYHRLAAATRAQTVWFAVYLFFLSLIVFHFAAGDKIKENLPVFLKNFPVVTFEKGVLTAPQQEVRAEIPQSGFFITFDAQRKTPPTLDEMTEKQQLMLISQNKLYMPSSAGVQSRDIPPSVSFSATPEFLAKHQADIAAALKVVAFLTACLLIPLMMLFGFCTAAAAGFFFKILTRANVPNAVICKWAVFLLGPLAALWYVRMWFYIPLFTLAQVILCLIYVQQIFNTLPEDR
ncbi:MAG: DUF1189 family protein [Candidatus Avelusimicrobium sp.]